MYKVPSARRKKRKFTPLNLIPILDVVFILIFFLLASAQLLRIFEIGSDLPIFQMSTEEKLKEDEFELKVSINRDSIILQNYKKGKVIAEIGISDWDHPKALEEFNEKVKAIADKHPEENRVLVASHQKVSYQNLVNVLDNLRSYKNATDESEKELFKQIMFEE